LTGGINASFVSEVISVLALAREYYVWPVIGQVHLRSELETTWERDVYNGVKHEDTSGGCALDLSGEAAGFSEHGNELRVPQNVQ
jgi:hypothetical protein